MSDVQFKYVSLPDQPSGKVLTDDGTFKDASGAGAPIFEIDFYGDLMPALDGSDSFYEYDSNNDIMPRS